MHYNHNRYYSPDLGRYITSDPIGLDGELNTYGYVLQNPLKYIDPDGKQPICFVWPWGTAVCAVSAIGTAATIKQCSDGLDDLEKGFESGKKQIKIGVGSCNATLLITWDYQSTQFDIIKNKFSHKYDKAAWAILFG